MHITLGHLRWALDQYVGRSDDELIYVAFNGRLPEKAINLMLVTSGDTLSIPNSQFGDDPTFTIKRKRKNPSIGPKVKMPPVPKSPKAKKGEAWATKPNAIQPKAAPPNS